MFLCAFVSIHVYLVFVISFWWEGGGGVVVSLVVFIFVFVVFW